MNKRKLARLLSLILAVLMPILTATVAFAETEGASTNASATTKYESPDISSLTGDGEEPEELSVSAGATYQEKAWYEYVTYSDHAVASYRLDDDHRILFYDPYTYTNSMVMDVQFDATTTEFDTMSEYTISKTKSKTISGCTESTYTNTTANQTSGKDEYGFDVTNSGYTQTNYNHNENVSTSGTVTNETKYEYIPMATASTSVSLTSILNEKIKIGTEIGSETDIGIQETTSVDAGIEWVTDKTTDETIYSPDYKTVTTYDGSEKLEDHTSSKTEGWEQLSARVTKTIGSSSSTSTSWSESESTTVTKKYAATHFASDGVTPLPWAIVHYSVQMPMKSCLQVKYSGEWITISTVYCLLTTVQGTCRSWMQNGQVYYEDWGNGEPVVATDFWSQFMTKDQLMKAYSDKLYPVGGEN